MSAVYIPQILVEIAHLYLSIPKAAKDNSISASVYCVCSRNQKARVTDYCCDRSEITGICLANEAQPEDLSFFVYKKERFVSRCKCVLV